MRLGKEEMAAEKILPMMFDLGSYESIYLSNLEFRKWGWQAVVSANIMGLRSLKFLHNFILNHPVFGTPKIYHINRFKVHNKVV